MANSNVTVTVTSAEPVGNLNTIFASDNTVLAMTGIANYMNGLASGNKSGSLSVKVGNGNAVQASLTATLTSVAVGDILLLNGIAFTAVASGAVAGQFNLGGSDSITATNLAAAITASTDLRVSGLFTASALSNVVTVVCIEYGVGGNAYDLEARGSGSIAIPGAGLVASGTLTFNNAGAATDTLTINGIAFTAVAAGAVGNQWNVGASATLSAAAAAAAINASVTAGVTNYVYATASTGVLTLKADRSGLFGNEFTIAGGQASITASGVRLTGGTDSAVVNMSGGVNDSSAKTYQVA